MFVESTIGQSVDDSIFGDDLCRSPLMGGLSGDTFNDIFSSDVLAPQVSPITPQVSIDQNFLADEPPQSQPVSRASSIGIPGMTPFFQTSLFESPLSFGTRDEGSTSLLDSVTDTPAIMEFEPRPLTDYTDTVQCPAVETHSTKTSPLQDPSLPISGWQNQPKTSRSEKRKTSQPIIVDLVSSDDQQVAQSTHRRQTVKDSELESKSDVQSQKPFKAPYFNPNADKDYEYVLNFLSATMNNNDKLQGEVKSLHEKIAGLQKELEATRESEATLRTLNTRLMMHRSRQHASQDSDEKRTKRSKINHVISDDQPSYHRQLVSPMTKSFHVCETDNKVDVANCVKLVGTVRPEHSNDVVQNILASETWGSNQYRCIAAFDDLSSNFKSVDVLLKLVTPRTPKETRTLMKQTITSQISSLINISSKRLHVREITHDIEVTGLFSITILDGLVSNGDSKSTEGGEQAMECSAHEAFKRLYSLYMSGKVSNTSLRFVEDMRCIDNPVRGALFHTLHKNKDKKYIVVEQVVVALGRQKQGIGNAMMLRLKRVARKESVRTIVVLSNKNTETWFRKHHFVPHGVPSDMSWLSSSLGVINKNTQQLMFCSLS